MGTGKEIGTQLSRWRNNGDLQGLQGQALANRLLDAAGDNQRLRGPLRELGQQPLFHRMLNADPLCNIPAALQALTSELRQIYSPLITKELTELLEEVFDAGRAEEQTSQAPRTPELSSPTAWSSTTTEASPAAQSSPSTEPTTGRDQAPPQHSGRWDRFVSFVIALRPLLPGVALSGIGVLAMGWLGGELERLVLGPWRWQGGLVLVLILACTQLFSWLGKGRGWPERGLLDSATAVDPAGAWRWISAPWLHQRPEEALLNLCLMTLVLGDSAVKMPVLMLGYCFTSLACLICATQSARRLKLRCCLGGASGVIAGLLSLSATEGLLQWQVISYELGPLRIPAWVLAWAYAVAQIAWIQPNWNARTARQRFKPILCSCWLWGSAIGLLAACLGKAIAIIKWLA